MPAQPASPTRDRTGIQPGEIQLMPAGQLAASSRIFRKLRRVQLGVACFLVGCSAARPIPAKTCCCEAVNTFPHDANAFTQGLVYSDGELYEGTGLNGRSSVRRVQLATGIVIQQYHLPWRFFGEGITCWENKLIQLTWTSGVAFFYDRQSLRLLSSVPYSTIAWGLTHDDTHLIISDGSATLCFRDPDTLAEAGRIRVTDGGIPVPKLNELEFIRGEIWANVWGEYRIARISPVSGEVRSWVDITSLLPPLDRLLVGSPNGIAYDAGAERVFVTGKRWPNLFEIRVHDPPLGNPRPAQAPAHSGAAPNAHMLPSSASLRLRAR